FYDYLSHPHFHSFPTRRSSDLWILVLAEIFLGERVDVLVGAFFDAAFHRTADLDVAVRVVGIEDRQRNRRALAQIARLDPALGGVHADHAAGVVEPDRRHLRRAVLHDRRDMREG